MSRCVPDASVGSVVALLSPRDAAASPQAAAGAVDAAAAAAATLLQEDDVRRPSLAALVAWAARELDGSHPGGDASKGKQGRLSRSEAGHP